MSLKGDYDKMIKVSKTSSLMDPTHFDHREKSEVRICSRVLKKRFKIVWKEDSLKS